MSFKSTFIGIGALLFILLILLPFVFRATSSQQPKSASPTAVATVGIFKSTDGGLNWMAKTHVDQTGVGFPVSILSMVLKPTDPNVIYIGTKQDGLWVSQNAGESWVHITDPQGVLKSDAEVDDIAISRSNPTTLYLAVFQDNLGRVLRSDNGGVSFTEVYRVSGNRFGVFGVAVDSVLPNRVYIATGQGGFFESSDAGKSWRIQKWFPDGLTKMRQNPENPAEYYVVSSHGEMFRTEDRGISWVRLTEGYRQFPKSSSISDFIMDSSRPNILYTASAFGLLRSEDSGGVWKQVDLIIPPEGALVRAVAVGRESSNTILAGVGSAIYKSDDFGEHWQVIQLPVAGNITMLRISAEEPSTVYAVVGK
ncbi:MAG: hypothetical protein A3C11_00985 [Candidatus Sungbacteria bacterium RIFCSPHIGHO2_02_FULL_49_12]|uniref:Photosynthesis system II assembly factor Ycf48/Hcf136-like domain-containing protein n=1 Tax=Candidatus Sungbacteria bacterium RIFCSPHIGHO2_02_FULL_49_12 TaxID=1802271 RepID=A0A1G2KNN8_9BACT|nr:MAG: hypothetical protein A3C11_00985 [Candidatus Sungbacteria bacterium RIFCSPHIGHO2_02_FULL_49_12]